MAAGAGFLLTPGQPTAASKMPAVSVFYYGLRVGHELGDLQTPWTP